MLDISMNNWWFDLVKAARWQGYWHSGAYGSLFPYTFRITRKYLLSGRPAVLLVSCKMT